MQQNIAFIGAGNMARAIFGGMLENAFPANQLYVTGRTLSKLEDLGRQGIHIGTDNAAAIAACEVVVLAVKPQLMRDVLQALQGHIDTEGKLFISVAAGISVASIDNWLGGGQSIVRCMPNTPSMLQQGASGLYAAASVSSNQRELAQQIISATGLALWVETEDQLDTVTALSGSGPAYFFYLMEAMIEAATEQGLAPQTAAQLALQTARGAAEMALTSDLSPSELRRQVTSPGGTTEQAILSYQREDFSGLIKRGMQANTDRSKALSKEFS
ncbi:MAG: pyrroline-5-carboxylate reductase [Pseudomonadales bacterium]